MTTSTHRKEREETMSRRILKTLALALVLGGVFAGSALARPVTDPSIYSVSSSSHAIVSEKTAGLTAVVPGAPAVVSEKVAGLRPDTLFSSEKTAGLSGTTSVPAIVSDHGVLLRPAIVSDHGILFTEPETRDLPVASGDNGIEWRTVGVGSALAVASLLALSALALGIRRRHLPLAH
jgi:hypothetical protein